MNAAGYWLFDSSTLWRDWKETQPDSPYYLPRPAAEYWDAYQQANEELDRSLADPNYESPLATDLGSKLALPAVPRSPEAIAESYMGDREMVPLHPESDSGPGITPPTLRCGGTLLVHAEAGETIDGTVRTVQIGSYPTSATWALLGPSGEELAANMAPLGEVDSFSVEAPETGVYTLFLQAGKNGIVADLEAVHWVLREYIDGSLWVVFEPPSLYFFVPSDVESFSISLQPGGGEEGADLRVLNADDECVLMKMPAAGSYEIDVPADQRGRPWCLELTKNADLVFEDMMVHLEGCPPVYALTPEALLVPPGEAK
jgi:hypothetical protein